MLVDVLSSFGQVSTKGLDEWDSLSIRNKFELERYEAILQNRLSHTDTFKSKNSIAVTYFSHNKAKLQKVEKTLDSNNCTIGIFRQFYNELGLVVYAFDYKKCCPEENQSDEKCFERVTFYERFEYDDKNRVIVHVFHVTTPMTYKETFKYDEDGTRRVTLVKISEPNFWK